ncbi:hypothetical protein FNB79_12670 [Formosa sediminum]|uniref:Uncharacterized protein n=1 Tax=Formosa sediminum TaxID=2594004 RepID=A0A516GTT0_9FLAO|nr:hypothetical protein [Formosa sediminum]QDO94780.1 hypothetical protein FNB79_12670 [Formosa sediminum]
MKSSQTLNYIFIIFGIIVSMYAKVDDAEHTYLLILGICSLLFGVFKISQTIPSKKDQEDNLNSED